MIHCIIQQADFKPPMPRTDEQRGLAVMCWNATQMLVSPHHHALIVIVPASEVGTDLMFEIVLIQRYPILLLR